MQGEHRATVAPDGGLVREVAVPLVRDDREGGRCLINGGFACAIANAPECPGDGIRVVPRNDWAVQGVGSLPKPIWQGCVIWLHQDFLAGAPCCDGSVCAMYELVPQHRIGIGVKYAGRVLPVGSADGTGLRAAVGTERARHGAGSA